MQDSTKSIEREAARRLPELLADLLDEPIGRLHQAPASPDAGVDISAVDARGRHWLFEVKSSSGPGVVARAARQLEEYADADALAVLVVPYMTPAGAETAASVGLNWVDLSGNAHIRDEALYISREGRPNAFRQRGRPSSPFAPKSARVARALLRDPSRWWRQKDLVAATGLDDGRVSRLVRRLHEDHLLERRGDEVRPLEPRQLLDAWAGDYSFNRHDAVVGHLSGDGIELARDISARLDAHGINHAFTGLPAAWLIDPFARFRLVSVYVEGDPRDAADHLAARRNERGANVQIIAPDDAPVMSGGREVEDIPIVSPVQVYLDLRHLPERAAEAADHLRDEGLLWTT